MCETNDSVLIRNSDPQRSAIVAGIDINVRLADACEWYHRQRLLVVGIIGKLVLMILFTFTGEAPNRHQKLDYRLCQSDYLHLPPHFEAIEYRKAA